MWGALAMVPLLLGSSAGVPQGSICAQTGPDIRAIIADNEVHVPPGVKALLLDTTDGKQGKVAVDVRQMRSKFDPDETTKWLNLALFQATFYNRASIADWLIGQGADVNSHSVNLAFADSPNPGKDDRMWPPIEQAADCGNTATLKVLLAHHADMYASFHEPTPMPGPLLLSIVNKHEDSITALLDHGYDPCLISTNYYPERKLSAVALAKRVGLSTSIVERLTALSEACIAPAPAQSAATH